MLIDAGDGKYTQRVEIKGKMRLQLEGASHCCDKCAGCNIEINNNYEMLRCREKKNPLFFPLVMLLSVIIHMQLRLRPVRPAKQEMTRWLPIIPSISSSQVDGNLGFNLHRL